MPDEGERLVGRRRGRRNDRSSRGVGIESESSVVCSGAKEYMHAETTDLCLCTTGSRNVVADSSDRSVYVFSVKSSLRRYTRVMNKSEHACCRVHDDKGMARLTVRSSPVIQSHIRMKAIHLGSTSPGISPIRGDEISARKTLPIVVVLTVRSESCKASGNTRRRPVLSIGFAAKG